MSSLIRSPLPSLISDAHFYISGNVTIHPSAVIAPGVMLQADPDSALTVADGVCIGVGCVLHAHQGLLEVETGATLGSRVLIVGQGRIGSNACIGSMTTIINSSVLPQQMVPPGSLIGDGSRQSIVVEASAVEASEPAAPSQTAPSPPGSTPEPSPTAPAPTAEPGEVRVVYGRAYMEKMMLTMFPHRQPIEEQGKG